MTCLFDIGPACDFPCLVELNRSDFRTVTEIEGDEGLTHVQVVDPYFAFT